MEQHHVAAKEERKSKLERSTSLPPVHGKALPKLHTKEKNVPKSEDEPFMSGREMRRARSVSPAGFSSPSSGRPWKFLTGRSGASSRVAPVIEEPQGANESGQPIQTQRISTSTRTPSVDEPDESFVPRALRASQLGAGSTFAFSSPAASSPAKGKGDLGSVVHSQKDGRSHGRAMSDPGGSAQPAQGLQLLGSGGGPGASLAPNELGLLQAHVQLARAGSTFQSGPSNAEQWMPSTDQKAPLAAPMAAGSSGQAQLVFGFPNLQQSKKTTSVPSLELSSTFGLSGGKPRALEAAGTTGRNALERERRARQAAEAANKKLTEALAQTRSELAEVKAELAETNKELAQGHKMVARAGLDWAREKQAKEKMKELCAGLSRALELSQLELQETRARLRLAEQELAEVRVQKEKLWEELEEEREAMALAEDWREHSAHVKLIEAQHLFEEKFVVLEALQEELEGRVRAAASRQGGAELAAQEVAIDEALVSLVDFVRSPEGRADFSMGVETDKAALQQRTISLDRLTAASSSQPRWQQDQPTSVVVEASMDWTRPRILQDSAEIAGPREKGGLECGASSMKSGRMIAEPTKLTVGQKAVFCCGDPGPQSEGESETDESDDRYECDGQVQTRGRSRTRGNRAQQQKYSSIEACGSYQTEHSNRRLRGRDAMVSNDEVWDGTLGRAALSPAPQVMRKVSVPSSRRHEFHEVSSHDPGVDEVMQDMAARQRGPLAWCYDSCFGRK